jgi:hypothetical protein
MRLILSDDYMNDYQVNHSIWMVINIFRKLVISIKNRDIIVELDAVKRMIEQPLFNHLADELKLGVK